MDLSREFASKFANRSGSSSSLLGGKSPAGGKPAMQRRSSTSNMESSFEEFMNEPDSDDDDKPKVKKPWLERIREKQEKEKKKKEKKYWWMGGGEQGNPSAGGEGAAGAEAEADGGASKWLKKDPAPSEAPPQEQQQPGRPPADPQPAAIRVAVVPTSTSAALQKALSLSSTQTLASSRLPVTRIPTASDVVNAEGAVVGGAAAYGGTQGTASGASTASSVPLAKQSPVLVAALTPGSRGSLGVSAASAGSAVDSAQSSGSVDSGGDSLNSSRRSARRSLQFDDATISAAAAAASAKKDPKDFLRDLDECESDFDRSKELGRSQGALANATDVDEEDAIPNEKIVLRGQPRPASASDSSARSDDDDVSFSRDSLDGTSARSIASRIAALAGAKSGAGKGAAARMEGTLDSLALSSFGDDTRDFGEKGKGNDKGRAAVATKDAKVPAHAAASLIRKDDVATTKQFPRAADAARDLSETEGRPSSREHSDDESGAEERRDERGGRSDSDGEGNSSHSEKTSLSRRSRRSEVSIEELAGDTRKRIHISKPHSASEDSDSADSARDATATEKKGGKGAASGGNGAPQSPVDALIAESRKWRMEIMGDEDDGEHSTNAKQGHASPLFPAHHHASGGAGGPPGRGGRGVGRGGSKSDRSPASRGMLQAKGGPSSGTKMQGSGHGVARGGDGGVNKDTLALAAESFAGYLSDLLRGGTQSTPHKYGRAPSKGSGGEDWQALYEAEHVVVRKMMLERDALQREHTEAIHRLTGERDANVRRLAEENEALTKRLEDVSDPVKRLRASHAGALPRKASAAHNDNDNFGSDGETIERLRERMVEQDKLLAGYQLENERAVAQARESRALARETERRAYAEKRQLEEEVGRAREEALRVGDRLLTAGTITDERAMEFQRRIDNLDTAVRQAQEELATANKKHAAEVAAMKVSRRAQVDDLNARLKWYADNQEELARADADIRAKDDELARLRSELEMLRMRRQQSDAIANANSMADDSGDTPLREGKGKSAEAARRTARAQANAGSRAVADTKRIRELEHQVIELEDALHKRYPNSIPALIRATKACGTETAAVRFWEETAQRLEGELASQSASAHRAIRALQQKHNNMRTNYELRIRELETRIDAAVPETAVTDQQRLKEQQILSKRIRDLERELDDARSRKESEGLSAAGGGSAHVTAAALHRPTSPHRHHHPAEHSQIRSTDADMDAMRDALHLAEGECSEMERRANHAESLVARLERDARDVSAAHEREKTALQSQVAQLSATVESLHESLRVLGARVGSGDVGAVRRIEILEAALADARQSQSPAMHHLDKLCAQVRDLEERLARREIAMRLAVQQTEEKWRRALAEKNAALARCNAEIEGMVVVLTDLKRQGIVLLPTQQHKQQQQQLHPGKRHYRQDAPA